VAPFCKFPDKTLIYVEQSQARVGYRTLDRGTFVDDKTRHNELAKGHLEAMRRDRVHLVEQIRQSQDAIARSQELIRRIDATLTKAGEKL